MDSLFLNHSYCVMFLLPILGLFFCSISEQKASFAAGKYAVLLFSFYVFIFILSWRLINGGE